MPSDNFDDNEVDPDSGRYSNEANRRKRQELVRNFGQGAQKRGGPQDVPPGQRPRGEYVGPGALPTGTAHQVELLLAKRQEHRKNLFIRLGIIVLLPAFIAWFYTALIATPRYVCNFEITYQAYQPTSSLSASLTQSAQGSSVTDYVDYGALLYEYIRSEALAEKVDQQINLRQHDSSSRIDSLSRLATNASQAAFLAYWRYHVAVSEGFGGYLTVKVQGFDPAFTLLLAQTISADADNMINGLSAQALISQVKSATDQLYITRELLTNADNALTVFRNTHGDLDPSFAATELATIVGTLESELASLRAQLQWSEANLQPGSSQIVQLKLQVSAMEQQIQAERQRLSASTGSTYSDTVDKYNDLVADQQFAITTYQAAQQGLIIAQADAASRQNYAVAFVPPILPDHPTMPDPFISSVTVFLAFLTLYAIGNLLFSAFRDQSGI
jgi:capsular polysaccharide transport system permease protein